MEENMQEKLEEIAMMIIANSGQARSRSVPEPISQKML